jgi:hypothetical protein
MMSKGRFVRFEQEFEAFLKEQRRTAKGLRLEQLEKDLTGEKKLLSAVLWPVLKSFERLTMEYERVSQTGVRIFIDVFYEPLGLAFESEGYVAHAENVTRERFTFERMRVRTIAMYGYKYIPFSWDELDKRPEACQRSVYELLGRFSSTYGKSYTDLSVSEREVIRYALRLNRSFRLSVLRSLMDKGLIRSLGTGKQRFHEFAMEDKARDYML